MFVPEDRTTMENCGSNMFKPIFHIFLHLGAIGFWSCLVLRFLELDYFMEHFLLCLGEFSTERGKMSHPPPKCGKALKMRGLAETCEHQG